MEANRSEIPASIRAELDQTPEWWDGQFRAAVAATIPRNPEAHAEHSIVETRTFTGRTVRTYCVECGVSIDPYEEGS